MELSINIDNYFQEKTVYKNRRDEIISLMVEDMNELRKVAGLKPLTKRTVAIRLNRNPFYAKDDTAVENLYLMCKGWKHYGKFWNDCK